MNEKEMILVQCQEEGISVEINAPNGSLENMFIALLASFFQHGLTLDDIAQASAKAMLMAADID